MGILAYAVPGRTPPQHTETGPCCCPACLGLACLDRPRFFAGQVLTHEDLNSLENYILAKNRLHNRYLHGPGVVCGLQVVCDDCEGYVKVRPGYAIDACGNDIIVCEETSFNLIQAIDECCRTRRKRNDCDPYRPPQPENCKDAEQHWCVTIEYREREARGVQPLRASQNCGCGCGGQKSSGCGCGCHCGETKTNGNGGAQAAPRNGGAKALCYPPQRTPQSPTECEPTRILETFKLCVIEEPPGKCAPAQGSHGALIDRWFACVKNIGQILTSTIPPATLTLIFQIAAGTVPPGTTPTQLYDACCKLRRAILELLDADPLQTNCSITVAPCPVPQQDPAGGGGAYGAAVQSAVLALLAILRQLIIDCFCNALLPPCGADPCDDRLILACVVVRDGKIIRICNFTCRSYAGSFPLWQYWLSVLPVGTLGDTLRRICCDEAVFAKADPNGRFLGALFAGDYAAPKTFAANLDAQFENFNFDSLTSFVNPASISVAALIGQPLDQAREVLKSSGIQVVERELAPGTKPPATLMANLLAAPGQTVVLYRSRETVAGFGSYNLAEQVEDLRREIESLRNP